MINREKLFSERLSLIPLTTKHISPKYVSWLNNYNTLEYLEIYEQYTSEDLETYLKEVEKSNVNFWGIFLKATKNHIGNIKISPINFYNMTGEYGILIGDENERGKGYAREASECVINYCANILRLRKLTLGVVSSNTSAINLYYKLGFREEGCLKNYGYYAGKLRDMLRMGLELKPSKIVNSKIILGTAQFMSKYGIENKKRVMNLKGCENLLHTCISSGINEFDTAPLYDDSLKILGNSFSSSNDIKINSKFSKISPKYLKSEVMEQLSKIKRDKVNTFFYHNPAEYKENKELLFELMKLKADGLISKIGVSGYETTDFLEAIEDPNVDVIQFPFNLLDNYIHRGPLITRAKNKGKEVQIRSVFLQGLLLRSKIESKPNLENIIKSAKFFSELANNNDMTIFTLCIAYVTSFELIDRIIIGVDSPKQLQHLLATISKRLNPDIIEQIHNYKEIDPELLNPTNW